MDTTDAFGGTWVKVTEFTDDGTWFNSVVTKSCIGSAIRCNIDNIDGKMEIKKWTVREIAPPS